MKIWVAWVCTPHDGTQQVWAASEREARKLIKNDWPSLKATVEQRDFPTTKSKLIEWLNVNCRE